jgi:hypothetical protein
MITATAMPEPVNATARAAQCGSLPSSTILASCLSRMRPFGHPAAPSVQINLRSEEVGGEAPDHLLGSGALFGLRQLQR